MPRLIYEKEFQILVRPVSRSKLYGDIRKTCRDTIRIYLYRKRAAESYRTSIIPRRSYRCQAIMGMNNSND